MATAPYIIRLALSDPSPDQKSHVLVAVTPKSEPQSQSPSQSNQSDQSDQSTDLDLKLVATDGIKVYVMDLQRSRLSRYRDEKSPGDDLDWADCLRALLLRTRPIGDVEAVARTPKVGEKLFIDVQKNVSGRARKYGELRLRGSKTAEDSLDLFDWCVDFTSARDRQDKELAELRCKYDDLKEHIAEETAKFEELQRSKHEFEDEHDSWLRDLLNEKKVKIRMQEQILATANVDQTKLAAVAAATNRRAAVGSSRKGKRKAQGKGLGVEHSNTDDEADKMDVDVDPDPDPKLSDDVGMTTPTASESESEGEPEPVPKPQPKKSVRNRASPASAVGSSRNKTQAVESEDDSPPPKALPANRKKPAPIGDDESTASDIDD